jgi:alanine-glyoxylate transaminase/serine-glyoxylate transaminase/serine-pyruvate transaminase
MANKKATAKHLLPEYKLMIPGPVEVADDVLQQMGAQVNMHYGPEFTAFYKETTALLKEIFRTSGDVYLLVGSGSSGLDAAIGSLLAPGERILIGVNGFFGERLVSIAQHRGLEVVALHAPWGEPLALAEVRKALQAGKDVHAMAIVHHETSTCVLNPVQGIAELANQYRVPLIVDAISSLGGEELPMDAWGIDICVAASQKCLEAPPGLAPLAISPRAWEIMDSKDFPAGWYLNLKVWRQYAADWGDWHPFPVTMATSLVRALRVAIEDLLDEGLERRHQRYAEAAGSVRNGLRELGFSLYPSVEAAASAASAFRGRPGLDLSALMAHLSQACGISIGGGIGELSGKVFRVGHMGKASSPPYIAALLKGVRDFLQASRA